MPGRRPAISNPLFHRTQLLMGEQAVNLLSRTRVILFGTGGVGSWCAEGLIRSGITDLTLIDSDVVCITNVNRQLQATAANVGQSKVLELKKRLLQINPKATVTPHQVIYDKSTRDTFNLNQYDYVIDAIDSVSCKVELIMHAGESDCTIYSAMGAACRLDPSRIQTGSIWKTNYCGLSRAVRYQLRKKGFKGDVTCVSSEEVLENLGAIESCGTEQCMCPGSSSEVSSQADTHEWCSTKKQINGSVVHITATFGFFLTGLVMQDIMKRVHFSQK
jgi:tRNA A37 threonylcarbamoyladenosine dehydratase